MSEIIKPKHLGLRHCVLEKIVEDAQRESGGDAEETVSINYSLLLELIDGYRASGWVREAPTQSVPAAGFGGIESIHTYKVGDCVRLTPYHEDNRPTVVEYTRGTSVILKASRGGYFCWNVADIESCESSS